MRLIRSRDIFYIVRDVLKGLDPKIINHGTRTSYILCKMLECLDKYEMYEIAEFGIVATLHDIGVYKTDYLQDQLHYETKDFLPHSIYGYLFFLYMTPFKDRAKILLYHHTDYNMLAKNDYEFIDIAQYLNVAEKMDLYSNILGERFDYQMFQKHSGTKYSPKALELLYQAEKKYNIFDKLSTGEYKQELNDLYEYLIFTNEEKEDWIVGLMHCVGFRSEYTRLDMVTCTNICRLIGETMYLPPEETELLYYAAVLHDAGMCMVPKEVIEAPRRLTDDEMKVLRTHVKEAEKILRGRIVPEILDIISAHHERGDGSGYPRKMNSTQFTRPQQILQIGDTITGLISPRSYRDPKTSEQVVAILKDEAAKGRLSADIVNIVVQNIGKIMSEVTVKNAEALANYEKMQEKYELTYKTIK